MYVFKKSRNQSFYKIKRSSNNPLSIELFDWKSAAVTCNPIFENVI